jgi:stage II sporulation protein D
VDEVRRALNADERTAVGRRLDAIEVLARDDSGRAAGLGVRGERSYTVRGDVLRAVLNRTFGARAVQSTRFDLARQGTRYILTGTGFGHGVGLCQRGAIARLRRGESVGGVLDTYFPGSRVGVAGS